MLTKQDLKNIGDLIDTKLEEKLESKLAPIHNELKMIKFDVKSLQKDMTIVKKDVKKLNQIVEKDFGFHEKQSISIIENVQNIQRNLQLPVMPLFIET